MTHNTKMECDSGRITSLSLQKDVGFLQFSIRSYLDFAHFVLKTLRFLGREIGNVEEAGTQDLLHAIESAKRVRHTWKSITPDEKSRILYNFSEIIGKNREDIALIETVNNGKPISSSLEDVDYTQTTFRYFAGWADKIKGESYMINERTRAWTTMEPIGIVGLIIPWNYPLSLFAWKVAPALASGNCVIVKTSEFTPLSALKLCELIKEAGFPPGVVSVLNGGAELGEAICKNSDIRKISFTGSTRIGAEIAKHCSHPHPKQTLLELGGKGLNIVFEDANIFKAIDNVYNGIFENMGQNCCAGSIALIHEEIYNRFMDLFRQKIEETCIMGDPLSPRTNFGPLISKSHKERVESFVAKAKAQGAKIYSMPLSMETKRLLAGRWFVPPTVLENVSQNSEVVKSEIFGPVLCVMKFKNYKEVIEISRSLDYGLASGIHTQKSETAFQISRELDVGMVWINTYNTMPLQTPFGGIKASGYGKELGESAIQEYTCAKTFIESI